MSDRCVCVFTSSSSSPSTVPPPLPPSFLFPSSFSSLSSFSSYSPPLLLLLPLLTLLRAVLRPVGGVRLLLSEARVLRVSAENSSCVRIALLSASRVFCRRYC